LIDGVAAFATGYGFGASIGLLIYFNRGLECTYEGDRSCAQARSLLIPIVGPVLTEIELSGWVRAGLLGTQVAGLGMTLAGILMFAGVQDSAPASDHVHAQGHRWRWSAAPLVGGALLTASTSF